MLGQAPEIRRLRFEANGKRKSSSDYVKSPFRYPGGKFYALRHIYPFIDCVPHDEYREPFVGGGTVFFAKDKATFNWINDLESDLVTTYLAIQNPIHRDNLKLRLSVELAERERHTEVKGMKVSTEEDIAFRTFYLNRTSYCGIIHKPAWGYEVTKSAPPSSWLQFIDQAGPKLQNVTITNSDFESVIAAPASGNSVLMYLDPPYYHADQKRAYIKHFVKEDHDRLAKALKQTDFLFCLSYDDCEEIRALYSWAEIHELNWLYNTANKAGEARKQGKELIITNYQVTRQSQQSLEF